MPTALETRRSAADRLLRGGIDVPTDLPIADHRDELVEVLRDHQVVVVAGETGSGKSTQLPKLCLEAGRGVEGLVGHTQPRRVAARTLSNRIADELGVEVGAEVGSSVRFDDRVGDRTLIRLMTDGILLAEIQRDPDLRRYDTLIIDEAHERSLNIDFILGYLAQLLPRRPDLHVVVTSATIDTERFAQHFSAAIGESVPIVEVSGRTYPVEIRYRPYGDDPAAAEGDRRDQVDAILDACDELIRDTSADILVFLAGEREIHDTADALRASGRPGSRPDVTVLPLYARLSAVEQRRVFEPHGGRRIVLATNVAETSITVPGVHAVVDAGTARISRYSRRLKVQRLPIEDVSQASANQRAGRCGRIAPGVCIRLYGEASFAERPEFTEPEILRTNLASVILQMANIGLGDMARFPFVEPPDRRTIRDGERLLDELGAIRRRRHDADPVRLTRTGRRLARLPIDPRLARMLLEADRLECVREVLVIVSALSIQDVRERPAQRRETADQLHARFKVDGSDLLSIVALWDHLRTKQRELSGNAFRRMCRDEFLHVLRIREWMDLHRQLRRVAKEMDIRTTNVEAHPDHVHRALLAGLLSQIGHRSTERSTRGATFEGARQAEFVIAPGSVLTRRPPEWVMAAELVDTGRIYARRVARIDPAWAEHLGSHLVSRSYGEPRWDEKHGRAVVTEQVTLFGLTLVSDRVLGLDRFDVDAARRVFVRRALVDLEVPGHWLDRHPTISANAHVQARLASLSDRVRTHDLLDDDDLFDFYDERIPDDVTSIDRFDRWMRERGADVPLSLDDGIATELLGRRGIDLGGFPDVWRVGGVEVPLTYRFAPGEPLDGVTAHVPLAALAGLPATPFGWQVPGRRRELVEATVRGLSKELRRELIPIDETIEAVLERMQLDRMGVAQGSGGTRTEAVTADVARPFADELSEHLTAVSGVAVSVDDVADAALPDDLRVHVVVARGSGEDTEVLAVGDDLDEIRRRLVDETRTAVAKAAPIEERRGIVEWDLGDLPRSVPVTGDGGDGVVAHPTLLDVGDSVSLRIVTSERVQQRAMRGGVRRLLLLDAAPARSSIERLLTDAGRLAIAGSDLELGALADDCIVAAVDSLIDEHGELPFAEADFRRLARLVRAKGANRAGTGLGAAVPIVVRAGSIARRLAELRAPSARDVVADVNDHLGRLVRPGFVAASGLDRLDDVDRYVRAIEHRVEHLAGAVDRDRRRLAEIRPLEQAYRRLVEGRPPDEVTTDLAALRWDLEELRVQVFAQPIGARGDVSPKRIRRRLAAAG